ncbi:hypothetical protein H7B90_05745 [Cohnella xylanilytica]|uniref:Uncharacterized protein n=1 Tax=Cohnella xylanilytica TaxID=557555 RepID=A0A841TXN4_9BACL|nr:hypothetical protein [Cohnella xylanilytica]MBB6690903.1 hypothetical protein [Cohnella xylanilytica]
MRTTANAWRSLGRLLGDLDFYLQAAAVTGVPILLAALAKRIRNPYT